MGNLSIRSLVGRDISGNGDDKKVKREKGKSRFGRKERQAD